MEKVNLLEKVLQKVKNYHENDTTGHGYDHIERVLRLSLEFNKLESENGNGGNEDLIILIAALHDADDEKLVSKEESSELRNARTIMIELGIMPAVIESVCSEISKLSFRKALQGIKPETIEGKIVSDADKCDAIGVTGQIRCMEYALSTKGSGVLFDWSQKPKISITAEDYSESTANKTTTFINHYFEKLLHIPKYILTRSGYEEAVIKNEYDQNFVFAILKEYDAPEEFNFYLNEIVIDNERNSPF